MAVYIVEGVWKKTAEHVNIIRGVQNRPMAMYRTKGVTGPCAHFKMTGILDLRPANGER